MRFRFRPGLTEAFIVYLVLPVLIVLSLGFYYPAWQRRKNALVLQNHRYGDAFVSFHAGNAGFYGAILLGGLIVFGGMLVLGAFIGAWTVLNDGVPPSETILLVLTVLLYGSAFFTGRHFTYPRVFNHIWNNTKLDEHRFVARLRPGEWMKLQWTNLLAIIFTAGLAMPWAEIRTARYRMECLSLVLQEPDALDQIDTMGAVGGSAVGDTAAEFVGVDFGF